MHPLLNNGFIIINKPQGPVSHEVTSWVKKLAGINRTGHAGTLDPNVSGVLPIALGRATKLLKYISAKDKTYIALARFRNEIPKEKILSLFSQFTGEITQTPPLISAVKKSPRKRTIYSLEFLEKKGKLVLFKACVEAGTYIRTLCEDMGRDVGGARMEELRRISVGNIDESIAVRLQDFSDALWCYKEKNNPKMLDSILHPPDAFISFPKIIVKNTAVNSLLNGAQLMRSGVLSIQDSAKPREYISLYTEDNRFIGVGKYYDKSPRNLAVKIDRIHLQKSEQ